MHLLIVGFLNRSETGHWDHMAVGVLALILGVPAASLHEVGAR